MSNKPLLEFDLPNILKKVFNTKEEITQKLSQKSDSNHSHGNITNNGKLNVADGILVTDDNKNISVAESIPKDKIRNFSHTHNKDEIVDFPSTIPPSNHTHNKEDITNFSHTHNKEDITNFSHTHNKEDITNFSHTHNKSELTDLYNYDISLSKYNLNAGNNDNTTTVTVKVTDMNNSPVNGHNVTIFKDEQSWRSGTTNSQGVYTTSYTASSEGLTTFKVQNQQVQCNTIFDTGWINLTPYSLLWVKTNAKPQIRRVGKTVHIRGTVKSKTTYPLLTYDDYINVCDLPDERFYPSMEESFVVQSSKVQRALLKSISSGSLVVGRFSDTKNDGSYTIPNDCGLTLNCSYFV